MPRDLASDGKSGSSNSHRKHFSCCRQHLHVHMQHRVWPTETKKDEEEKGVGGKEENEEEVETLGEKGKGIM